ncbi:response regulator transcription factor [Deinococcus antarcticus]|uniref:Response regulator transcription factor n=1 Tax=Deinococcus antarcticus TaxID=1298767 RepID=A0ABV8A1P9_9DEIO
MGRKRSADRARAPGAARGRGRREYRHHLPTATIATKLHLSEGTVRNYLSEAISKLGAENRVEAARTAREKGWL